MSEEVHEPFGSALGVYSQKDGRRVLADSAVLYMDVLGFAQFGTGPDAQRHLEALLHALPRAREAAFADFSDGVHVPTWFTDNVAVGFPVALVSHPAVSVSLAEMMAARLQLETARQGYFFSGGVALGPAYFEPDFVYGAALVEAVDQEKRDKAINGGALPRVILAPTAEAQPESGRQGMLEAHARDGRVIDPSVLDGVCLRRSTVDDLTFVSYLDWMFLEFRVGPGEDEDAADYLVEHRDAVCSWLAEPDLDPRVHAKYAWVAGYHDVVCAEYLPGRPELLTGVTGPPALTH